MNYKVNKVVSKFKKNILGQSILWLIITIVFVAPVAYSVVNSTANGRFLLANFIEDLIPSITKFTTFFEIWSEKYINTFIRIEIVYTVIYAIMIAIGLSKQVPNSEYSNIEHGSSDWSEHGAQYKVLDRHEGILLAQENYLPLDKRGNINVMIVGRIWCW